MQDLFAIVVPGTAQTYATCYGFHETSLLLFVTWELEIKHFIFQDIKLIDKAIKIFIDWRLSSNSKDDDSPMDWLPISNFRQDIRAKSLGVVHLQEQLLILVITNEEIGIIIHWIPEKGPHLSAHSGFNPIDKKDCLKTKSTTEGICISTSRPLNITRLILHSSEPLG